jgi:HD-like signal output (HDOD) protein
LEKAVFGFDHGEIGAQLLRRWGMPEEIVAPVFEHIDPAGCGTPANLTVMTYAASALAKHIHSQATSRFADSSAAKFAVEFLQLQPGQVNGWEHLVRARVAQLAVLETQPA